MDVSSAGTKGEMLMPIRFSAIVCRETPSAFLYTKSLPERDFFRRNVDDSK